MSYRLRRRGIRRNMAEEDSVGNRDEGIRRYILYCNGDTQIEIVIRMQLVWWTVSCCTVRIFTDDDIA